VVTCNLKPTPKPMRATEFEFRHRFWFICLTYFLGFACYKLDPANVTDAFLRWIVTNHIPRMNPLTVRYAFQAVFAFSAVLVAAGAWVRTWGGAYLRAEVVHDVKLRTERLVADGPYRHVRNPLYLGSMLLATGMALLASRTGCAVVILGNLLIFVRLIGREEAALVQSQGEAYRAYLAAVPRLWPSLRPRLPASGVRPKWLQALLGEGWMWAFALAGFLFAWKLDVHLYAKVLWAVVAYRLLWVVVERRRWRNSATPAAEMSAPLAS